MIRRSTGLAFVSLLGLGIVLLTGRVDAQAGGMALRLDVLECVLSEGADPAPCGVAGDLADGNVPWSVEVSPCGGDAEIIVGVMIESRLEPCVSEPAECDGTENFKEGNTFGCTDGQDNDSDGLTDLEDPDCKGVKAWSFSLATDPCFNIQTDGTTVSGTVSDLEINGGRRSLAGSFSKTAVVDPAENDGQPGVVMATVLAFSEPVILEQNADHLALRVRGILSSPADSPCGLRFDDPPGGLVGGGDPVRTVITVGGESIAQGSEPVALELRNATIDLTAPSGGEDCNGNKVVDSCEIADGSAADCDGNGVPDSCDIEGGATDCDGNGVPDSCDLAAGAADCDGNGVPDSCDIAGGAADCDGNGVPDSCDIAGGAADCDGNGVPDSCDISGGAADCDGNGVPDSCDISGGAADCDGNGVPDSCDLAAGAPDCNENGVPDSCDIASGTSQDAAPADGVPDECAPSGGFIRGDCDADGTACSGVNDALFLLTWFFSGGDEPGCLAACDVNGDGEVEGVSDAISNLNFCFQGSEPPPAPFPDCGPGTKADAAIGCLTFPAQCQ